MLLLLKTTTRLRHSVLLDGVTQHQQLDRERLLVAVDE